MLRVWGNYCACQYFRKHVYILFSWADVKSLTLLSIIQLYYQSLTSTEMVSRNVSTVINVVWESKRLALWWLGLCVVNDTALVWLREWRETGVMLLDQENNTVGYSKAAARRGVTMVALSRILMAVPSCGKTLIMCSVLIEYLCPS